ncbi:MBOAT family protein, partial [Flavobacteriaceae bacterium]|nr:MBOAT family protein [Flavobacteriaceae bacterium]
MNKSLKAQNTLLLVSSYVFYGWWDWRFLGLIFLSTAVDYHVGKKLGESTENNTRCAWLWISIVFNLGLLGYFKYYNFFITSWLELFQMTDQSAAAWTIKIILPVGISFYTFQTMSYSLDIYKKKLKPVHDFISFAAY